MLINSQWITRLKLNLAINLLMEFVWFVLFVTLRSQTKASRPPPPQTPLSRALGTLGKGEFHRVCHFVSCMVHVLNCAIDVLYRTSSLTCYASS
jgi:hypothetical protein